MFSTTYITVHVGIKAALQHHMTAESEGRTSSCWASAGTCAQGDQISTVLGVSAKDAEGTDVLVWGYISVTGQL